MLAFASTDVIRMTGFAFIRQTANSPVPNFPTGRDMADANFSDQQLLGYLDEMLPADEMTSVEKALRDSDSLRRRTAGLSRRRDDGVHAVGEIWRRLRLSCPSRSRLGSYVLGTLDRETRDYIEFHLETIGCRICAANLADINESAANNAAAPKRRQRYFQSSAGLLKAK